MGIYDLIKSRKPTYGFSKRPVSEEAIINLLDAARLAPSAGGIHEYEFVVVAENNSKNRIAEICMTPNIQSAPYIIVVVCDPAKIKNAFGDNAGDLCIANAAMAIDNIMLFATELGLGSAWISNFDATMMKDMLGIPSSYIIRGVIPIGYPIDENTKRYPSVPPPLKNIVHEERFNNKAK